MDGLGYGLINKSGTIYYNCNYKGYTYQYAAPLTDIHEVEVEYDEYDKNDKLIGKITRKEWVMKDIDVSAKNIKTYFEKNITASLLLKTWYAESLKTTVLAIKYYDDWILYKEKV